MPPCRWDMCEATCDHFVRHGTRQCGCIHVNAPRVARAPAAGALVAAQALAGISALRWQRRGGMTLAGRPPPLSRHKRRQH